MGDPVEAEAPRRVSKKRGMEPGPKAADGERGWRISLNTIDDSPEEHAEVLSKYVTANTGERVL